MHHGYGYVEHGLAVSYFYGLFVHVVVGVFECEVGFIGYGAYDGHLAGCIGVVNVAGFGEGNYGITNGAA